MNKLKILSSCFLRISSKEKKHLKMGLMNMVISTRHQCSVITSENLSVSLDKEKGIATVSLNKIPVNSLNLEYLKEFTQAIKTLESINKCKGFILISKIPNVFSAGLDIKELHKPNIERFSAFWKAVQDMWITLYASPLITIAGISGNAPGAGCILALSCDYRIMVDSRCHIGISGTKPGMISPWWFEETFKNVVGHRETELALTLGKSYTPQEALGKGLVDELATSPNEVLAKAEQQLQKWIQIPISARQATKRNLRTSMIEKLLASRENDIDNYVSFITENDTQNAIGNYLESLKKDKV